MIPRYPWPRFEARILFDQNQTLVNPCLTRTPRTTKGTSLCVPQLQRSMSTHKRFTTQSRKLPGKAFAAQREQGVPGVDEGEGEEQEVADRRKAAAAKAALTKERKAAKAAAEADAAKEAAELRQQLKAARKERRTSDN